MSSTVGSLTKTGWNRRARAASFSTCLRYSSRVVAPMQCSSPRARAGFRRFEASIAPSPLPAPTKVVHLVNEQDDAAGRGRHLVQHGLQPLLELTTVFRAGDQRAQIERQELLVFEAFRHVAVDDAQREAFDDRGLADTGFADQHGVVLGAARQHLDRAADLLVAADDGVELAGTRRLGQVAGIFLESVVAVLGRGTVGLAALAQVLDGAVQHLGVHAGSFEDAAGLGALVHRDGEQKPFDRDETVAGLLGDLLGLIEQARRAGREIELTRAASRHFRQFGERDLGRLQGVARAPAGPVDEARRESLVNRRAGP